MTSYEFYGYYFEVDGELLLVRNESGLQSQIWFIKPSTLFAPYSNAKFNNQIWSKVRPSNWCDQNDNYKVNIEIIQEDKLYLFEFDTQTLELKDVTNPLIKVTNFEIEPLKISIIISAFDVKNYLEDCLSSLVKQKSKYYQVEILLGIDNCYDTLRALYRLDLPANVKAYFFEENVGKFIICNTLVSKSNADYLLFFDSDDIAHDGILDYTKFLVDQDLLILNCLTFENGKEHLNSSNLTNIGGCQIISRDTFLSMNGYQPWRCSGDDEFIRRSRHQGLKILSPEGVGYYYRINPDGLSRSKTFNTNSNFRGVYLSILTLNQASQSWPNPKRLFTDRCFKIF